MSSVTMPKMISPSLEGSPDCGVVDWKQSPDCVAVDFPPASRSGGPERGLANRFALREKKNSYFGLQSLRRPFRTSS